MLSISWCSLSDVYIYVRIYNEHHFGTFPSNEFVVIRTTPTHSEKACDTRVLPAQPGGYWSVHLCVCGYVRVWCGNVCGTKYEALSQQQSSAGCSCGAHLGQAVQMGYFSESDNTLVLVHPISALYINHGIILANNHVAQWINSAYPACCNTAPTINIHDSGRRSFQCHKIHNCEIATLGNGSHMCCVAKSSRGLPGKAQYHCDHHLGHLHTHKSLFHELLWSNHCIHQSNEHLYQENRFPTKHWIRNY